MMRLRVVVLYGLTLLAIVLCGPIGFDIIEGLRYIPLSAGYHEFLKAIHLASLGLFCVWGLLMLVAPIALVIAVRKKRLTFFWFSVLLVTWGAWPLATQIKLSTRMKRVGLQLIAGEARPVIQALDAYCNKERRCPQRLEDLTPNYIGEIPRTGAAAYSVYKYLPASSMNSNNYELRLDVSFWGWGQEYFIYRQDQSIPIIPGLVAEKMDGWAYLHAPD